MARKLLLLMLVSVMLFTAVAGCSWNRHKSVTAMIGLEPGTLDPAFCDTSDEATYIAQVYEGLFRLDSNGIPEYGAAEAFDRSADGLTYTFRLKSNAKWSDGKPVTAYDFEYAWKRVLNPETGSQLAPMLYCLVNGEEYSMSQMPEYKGKKATESEVGVKAKDKSTLEVRFKAPVPYFSRLVTYAPFMPVRADIIEKYDGKLPQNSDAYAANGPFTPDKWEKGKMLLYRKNPYYYDSKTIVINKLSFYFGSDRDAALKKFNSGTYDVVYNLVPYSQLQLLKTQGILSTYNTMNISFLNFNTSVKPLNDARVRNALALAINRKKISADVLRSMDMPAAAWVPPGVAGEKSPSSDFRKEAAGSISLPEEGDVQKARNLLAEAGYPEGKGFPELEFIYTGDSLKSLVESIQEQWRLNLGINIRVYNKGQKEFGEAVYWKRHTIAVDGMTGTYNDAIAFLSAWVSNGINNKTGWGEARYDELINRAAATNILSERTGKLRDAEKILVEEAPVSPLFWNMAKVLKETEIKGLLFTPEETIYFQYAKRASGVSGTSGASGTSGTGRDGS